MPINFYGKLEDQFQNPVVGAKIKKVSWSITVKGEARTILLQPAMQMDCLNSTEKAKDIGMMPQKEGYALASPETFFKFSRMEDHPYVSDANSPTVIKMWKLQGAEPLASINQHYRLHNTVRR